MKNNWWVPTYSGVDDLLLFNLFMLMILCLMLMLFLLFSDIFSYYYPSIMIKLNNNLLLSLLK